MPACWQSQAWNWKKVRATQNVQVGPLFQQNADVYDAQEPLRGAGSPAGRVAAGGERCGPRFLLQKVIQLKDSAARVQVKDAYRRLCLQHHPDMCSEHLRPAAEQYFKDVTGAYARLTKRGGFLAATNSARLAASMSISLTSALFTGRADGSAAHWPEGGAARWPAGAAGAAARKAAAPRYSNGVVAAVIAAPLVLLGFWLQAKRRAVANSEELSLRPHGLLNPTVNPFLREDLRPTTYSRRFWRGSPAASPAAAANSPGGRQGHQPSPAPT